MNNDYPHPKFSPFSGRVLARRQPLSAWSWRHPIHRWHFNPWTGGKRDPGDVKQDPHGLCIVPPGQPLYAAPVNDVRVHGAVKPLAADLTATLTERGSRYGKFTGHAGVTMRLKDTIRIALASRDKKLADDQAEALDMICHKIGRIVNGDANYADSWVDIAGYAKLVADRLEGIER